MQERDELEQLRSVADLRIQDLLYFETEHNQRQHFEAFGVADSTAYSRRKTLMKLGLLEETPTKTFRRTAKGTNLLTHIRNVDSARITKVEAMNQAAFAAAPAVLAAATKPKPAPTPAPATAASTAPNPAPTPTPAAQSQPAESPAASSSSTAAATIVLAKQEWTCKKCNTKIESDTVPKNQICDNCMKISLSKPNMIQVTSPNGMRVIPINVSNYYRTSVPPYVEIDGEMKLCEAHLNESEALLLSGPKGVAKTLMLAHFAKLKNIPLIQFDCSEDTDAGDLIGKFVIQGEETPVLLGMVPTAIEIANHIGQAVVVFEEVNTLSPAAQKMLNPVFDWRKKCEVPSLGKTFQREPKTQILFAATMNYGYAGTFELNEDLKSRFVEWHVGYPDAKTEKSIIKSQTNIPENMVDNIIQLANETRKSEAVTFKLSPRECVKFGVMFVAYQKVWRNAQDALKMACRTTVLNKYNDETEREFIKTRIESIMGVKL